MSITDPNVTLKRSLVTLESRVRELPTEWRRHIEPKIERRWSGKCWFWIGAKDHYKRPVLTDPDTRKVVLAKRYIAKLFWQFPATYFVNTTCGGHNCVNPAHLEPSPVAGHREPKED